MRSISSRRFCKGAQDGFMLLSAVFVLLICATLGVVIVNGVEQGSANRAVNYWSTQAHMYAESSLGFVTKNEGVCQNAISRQALEAQLSSWFSTENRACTLRYDCDAQAGRVIAGVSCEINRELRVSRSALLALPENRLLTQ